MNEPTRLEHVECKLCGVDSPERLFTQQDRLTGDPAVFGVVRCTNCGLVYVDPRPVVDCIARFYPPHFISYQLETFDGPGRTLREYLVGSMTHSSAKAQVKAVEHLFRRAKRFRVLDIGCGKGRFLQAVKVRGCEVSGLDFDPDAINYCRNTLHLDVQRGGPTDLDTLDTQYDLVTMWQFLEHVFDPLATVQAANRRLAMGRHLVIQIPNVDSLETRVFKERSNLFDVPRHLYHFSRATVTRLLESAGFEVERIESPVLAGGWIGSIQSNFLGGALFADVKGHVYAFFGISIALAPLEYVLSKTNLASLLTVTARKVSEA